MIKSILLTGVGGQGIVLTSDIISGVLFKAGFDVKTSSVKGMSRRLGSVISNIRFGEKVYSPVISKADYFLGFELLESLKHINYLDRRGIGIVNNYEERIQNYPNDIVDRIKKNNIILVNGQNILGNTKCINLLLLGILSKHLDIKKRFWIEGIKDIVPEKYFDANLRAFDIGAKFRTTLNKVFL